MNLQVSTYRHQILSLTSSWSKSAVFAAAFVGLSWSELAVSATPSVAMTHQTVAAAVMPASGATPEIAVFYLGKGQPTEITRDGVQMQIGWELPEVPSVGKRPLVVLSHGSDGNPWQHSDLAKQLVHAGFVVAAPFHVGDNSRDHDHSTLTTWENWRLRPTHVSATIDVMAQSRRWPARADRVGVFGMSAGGHTALTMAGGKWSADRFRQHCNQHIREDFQLCSEGRGQLKGNWLDWLRMADTLARLNYHMRDQTCVRPR
jgi:predicted dienelactone hydrolase